MNRDEFKVLFEKSLNIAVEKAEQQLGYEIPKKYQIELHGAGFSGALLDVETVFSNIYLGKDRFYLTIDLSVKEITPQITKIFMGVGGRQPDSFDKTWNQPPGMGPFKPTTTWKIRVSSE